MTTAADGLRLCVCGHARHAHDADGGCWAPGCGDCTGYRPQPTAPPAQPTAPSGVVASLTDRINQAARLARQVRNADGNHFGNAAVLADAVIFLARDVLDLLTLHAATAARTDSLEQRIANLEARK